MKYRYSNEELILAVKKSLSIAGVCRELGIKPVGGNYKTINCKIKELSLDTSHFTGQGWNVGLKFKPSKEMTLDEILVEDSPYKSSTSLKRKLLKYHVKEPKCEMCGRTEWLGKPIPLEIHHVNGNNMDNRIENLQILCPNCHSFTDNYRGKNQCNKRIEKNEKEYESVKNGEIPVYTQNEKQQHKRKPKQKVIKYCAYCGKEMYNKYNKCCSVECAHRLNGSKRPKIDELIAKFDELKSNIQVGKYYGVTDSAVRKWVKFYGVEDIIRKHKKWNHNK